MKCLQNSQEDTCTAVSFIKTTALQKDRSLQPFSCEFIETFQNTSSLENTSGKLLLNKYVFDLLILFYVDTKK